MYELDNRKDHTMTVFKVALANLAMWVRDSYFPASYARAAWKRLLPFFQLSGTITHHAQMVQVGLRPFNDRALNRDLAILCERVNQASPHLPDVHVLAHLWCSRAGFQRALGETRRATPSGADEPDLRRAALFLGVRHRLAWRSQR